MKTKSLTPLVLLSLTSVSFAGHPDTSEAGWADLFSPDLGNAIYDKSVWTYEDGILTASEDQNIYTSAIYENFILDLEFKTADGTNSGVIVYCSDIINWIPNSVEIQIADDFSEHWNKADPTWKCGAIFGHLAATHSNVKRPGEWNRYTIIVCGKNIQVILNGEKVNEMDLSKWTSATENPDGSSIPPWLSTPFAELPTYGHIGLQGKHAGAPIWFRNIRVNGLRKSGDASSCIE